MTLAPTWERTIDGTTEAGLTIVDRELVGSRLFLALERRTDRGFSVRRIDARTGKGVWTSTHVSDELDSPSGPVGEAVRDLVATKDGSQVFTIGVSELRITRFRGSDGASEVVDVLPGTDGEQLALTPDDHMLLAAGDGLIAAYDRASSMRLWTANLPTGALGDLTADSRRAFVITGGSVLALNLTDGSTAWSAAYSTFGPLSLEMNPTGGLLVVSGGFLLIGGGGSIGIHPETGAVVWSDSRPGTKRTTLSPDGSVVFRSSGGGGLFPAPTSGLDALDARTGAILWSTPIPPEIGFNVAELSVSPNGALVALAAAASTTRVYETVGGTLVADVPFAPSEQQTLFASRARRRRVGGDSSSKLLLGAFDAGSGKALWTVDEKDADGADRLAASNRMLIAVAGEELLAHDERDGKRIWSRALQGVRDLVVARDGTALYVARTVSGSGDDDIGVQKIDAATGVDVWTMTFDGGGKDDSPRSLALSPDGGLLFVTARKELAVANVATLALREESGAVLWEATSPEGDQWTGLEVLASDDGSRVYILGGNEKVDIVTSRFFAYEAATGAEVWKTAAFGASGGASSPPPIACALSPDGSRLAGAGSGFHVFAGKFTPLWRTLTIDTTTGFVDWDEDVLVGFASEVMDVVVTGADPTVVVTGEGTSTLFAGFDLQTGDQLFDARSIPSSPPGAVKLLRAPSSDRIFSAHTQGFFTSDLRAAAYDLPSLVSSPSPISLRRGGVRELRVRAGAELGGASFAILGSASGLFRTQASHPVFRGFLGQLGPEGEGRATFRVPPGSNPALAGIEMTHLAIVTSPEGDIELVTNPVTLALKP